MKAAEALHRAALRVWSWFDGRAMEHIPCPEEEDRAEWQRVVPFLAIHLACLAAFWLDVSVTAVVALLAMYALRMFAITAFYHRYFAHRSFRTSRGMQLLFALLGDSAGQRGPLWWSAHHRLHHRHSDSERDAHSPRQHGFWWSHFGWVASRRNFRTCLPAVKDLARYPELVLVDRFHAVPPLALALGLYVLGCFLRTRRPDLQTSGPQLLVWGFFLSTTALYHSTFAINSFAHLRGARRYATGDHSGNSLLLALLTFGEGWHNNHHYYPRSARQGFYWWEIDLTYYVLKLLAAIGVIWDLHVIPDARRDAGDGAGVEKGVVIPG